MRSNGRVSEVDQSGKDCGQLRVCMVAYTNYEGDNRVMRYAETLASRGDQVDVIALRSRHDEPDLVVNGVNVIKIQMRERNEKGRFVYLFRLLTFLLKSAWILNKRHRKLPYDLIHVHSVPDFLVFAAWFPRASGAKVILDIHDVLPELYSSKFSKGKKSWIFKMLLWVEKISARVADHVIIANDLWRERLVARSVPEEKCTSILNFPDGQIFHRTASAPHDGHFVILYPGSLNWHQGLDLAIAALARIHNEVPNVQLHIYGGGPEKEKLRLLAHNLSLDNKVFIYGSMPLRDIVKVMQDADLGIVPKRSNSFGNEAFSTKTLEFMSLGIPLIVADTAVDRYYFNDSLVKFFHSGDEEDLAAAMLQMIRDSKLRQELAKNGLDFARRNNWECHKYIYLNIVDGLTKNTKKILERVS
jgi:glycosyltransferase involved in cell wall biosynthesis